MKEFKTHMVNGVELALLPDDFTPDDLDDLKRSYELRNIKSDPIIELTPQIERVLRSDKFCDRGELFGTSAVYRIKGTELFRFDRVYSFLGCNFVVDRDRWRELVWRSNGGDKKKLCRGYSGTCVVDFKYLLDTYQNVSENNYDRIIYIKNRFRYYINFYHYVVVDFVGVTTLSTNIIYKVFGHLYDDFGDDLIKSLQYTNDIYNFSYRINKAIDRRALVLDSEKT